MKYLLPFFIALCINKKTLAHTINKYEVKEIINSINNKLPKTYFNEITRKKVVFDYKNYYVVNRYILLNDNIIHKYLHDKKNIKEKIMKNLCEANSDTRRVNESGIGMRYIYYDFRQKELFSILVRENECKNYKHE